MERFKRPVLNGKHGNVAFMCALQRESDGCGLGGGRICNEFEAPG